MTATSEAPSHYDLRSDVTRILYTTELTDPGDIAETILEDIPEDALRSALSQTLRAYVRHVMWTQRSQTPDPDQRIDGTQERLAGVGTNPSGRSWAREGIREGWRSHLKDRYHVAGEHKMLRDLSATDLDLAAAERHEIAAQNAHTASELEKWSGLVREHGVARFGLLPDTVLAEALGGTE